MKSGRPAGFPERGGRTAVQRPHDNSGQGNYPLRVLCRRTMEFTLPILDACFFLPNFHHSTTLDGETKHRDKRQNDHPTQPVNSSEKKSENEFPVHVLYHHTVPSYTAPRSDNSKTNSSREATHQTDWFHHNSKKHTATHNDDHHTWDLFCSVSAINPPKWLQNDGVTSVLDE